MTSALRVPAWPLTVEGGGKPVTGSLDLNPESAKHGAPERAIRAKFMTNGDHWRAFVEMMRGTRNAYAPVHEVMQGHLAREFAAHHENLSGTGPRVSKATTGH